MAATFTERAVSVVVPGQSAVTGFKSSPALPSDLDMTGSQAGAATAQVRVSSASFTAPMPGQTITVDGAKMTVGNVTDDGCTVVIEYREQNDHE